MSFTSNFFSIYSCAFLFFTNIILKNNLEEINEILKNIKTI